MVPPVTPAKSRSSQSRDAPVASQQLEDLNFYLRGLSLNQAGDISHIEAYRGEPDYDMFLNAVTSVGLQYGWTEAQILRTVELKLKDKAREYYGALLPTERPTTMAQMRKWFRRVFGRKLTINSGKRELEGCIRNPEESLGEYAHRLKVIVNKMFPASSLTSAEKVYHRNLLLVNHFLEGLEGRLANEILRVGEFHNLDDCLEVAEECEEIVSRMVTETRYDARTAGIRRVEASSTRGSDQDVEPFRNRDNATARRRMRGNARRRPTGRMRRSIDSTLPFSERFPYMKNRCTRCGDMGHLSLGCRNPRKLFCYHCGKLGGICGSSEIQPSLTQQRNLRQ